MKKADIAKRIQELAGVTPNESIDLLERVLTLIKTTLQKGETVMISEFGTFSIREKTARQGRNPKTGESMTITSRRVVKFRASAKLREAANTSMSTPLVTDPSSPSSENPS